MNNAFLRLAGTEHVASVVGESRAGTEIDEAVAYAAALQEDYDRQVAERDSGVVSKPYLRKLVASRNRAVDPLRHAKMRLRLDAVLAESYHCQAGLAVLLYP